MTITQRIMGKNYVTVERVEAWWSSDLILEVLRVTYKLQGGSLSFVVSSMHCQLLAYMLIDTSGE
jgi:hypothetical protein